MQPPSISHEQLALSTSPAVSEEYVIQGSERFFTIPTVAMTMPRAIIGIALPFLAHKGKNTTALTLLGAASDKETPVADLVDSLKPEWGLGRSIPGADADYKADFIFGVGAVVAPLVDERSEPIHKVAAAINAVKFASQGVWAVQADRKHREITGKPLKTQVGFIGKVATALAMTSAVTNTKSREMTPQTPKERALQRGLAYTSLFTATGGLILSEAAKGQNDRQFRAKVGLPTKQPIIRRIASLTFKK